MAKRQISNLDLKIKLTNEYLNNGGVKKIWDKGLLEDLLLVKSGPDGKPDPDTVSTRVNAFMLALLASQLTPPFFSPYHISEYETTLQKSNSFDQQNIDTPEQFDKIYEEYKSKTDFLFRGQREAKWRLYGTLQRHWIQNKLYEKIENYQALLQKLVELGRTEYKQKYLEQLGEMHDDADNDISVLSFLQHHGCPTPLLDWTYRFQNALFFALDGLDTSVRQREIDDYFSVYFIEEKDFEKGSMRSLMYESIEKLQEHALKVLIKQIAKDEETRIKMEEHFKGRKAIDIKRIKGSGMISYMITIEHMINFPATYFSDGKQDDISFSLNNSINIQNQAGAFTWNADASKPFEIVVNEQNNEANKEKNLEKGPQQYVFCECFNINKNLAGYIAKKLEDDGITRELIYPVKDFSTWDIFEKTVSDLSRDKISTQPPEISTQPSEISTQPPKLSQQTSKNLYPGDSLKEINELNKKGHD